MKNDESVVLDLLLIIHVMQEYVMADALYQGYPFTFDVVVVKYFTQ